MPSDAVSAFELSDDEVLGLGLSPLVHAGDNGDPDSMIAEAFIHGQAQVDRDGRPVISYKQYKQLAAADARLENFAMRMGIKQANGQVRTGLIQASKYLKWYGQRWRPIEELNRPAAPTERAVRTSPTVDAPKAFFCSEKYPECPRFFDTEKGLKFHWRKDHTGLK